MGFDEGDYIIFVGVCVDGWDIVVIVYECVVVID